MRYQPLRQFCRAARALLAALLLLALAVGIPWGLVRFVGWPLPDHLTTWTEIQDLLLAPLSTSFLLNTLACLLWPTWAVFVLDVVRTTLDMVRTTPWPEIRPAGLVHALATALVGTIVLALATSRPAPPSVPAQATTVVDRTATSTSSPVPAQPASSQAEKTPRAAPARAVVRPPHDGVYDSLWRIAERELGDGHLWPKIYALNQGRPQPDGRALTTPGLIRPGWILHLPNTPRPPLPDHDDHTAPGAPKPPPSPSPQPTTPHPPSTQPAPSHSQAPGNSTHHNDPDPGISLPSGAFVGLGLAASITAAWLLVQRRRRVRYHPGSGRREDLTVAPVVRALRIANDQTHFPNGVNPSDPHSHPAHLAAPRQRAAQGALPKEERVIGTKDGQPLALDLARTRGLGLVGPRAPDALRALTITLLAEQRRPAPHILIPAQDLHLLIGENHPPAPQLGRLHVVDDLDMALDRMEAELLTRTRTETGTATSHVEELVLVATPAPHLHRRLQAVLDNGSTFGMAGVLIGQWRPGATARVRADGTVAATSASLTSSLEGTRLFTLPSPDSQALLNLLSEAEAEAEVDSPHHRHSDVAELPTRDSSRQGASSTSQAERASPIPERTHPGRAPLPSSSSSPDSAELLDIEPPPTSAPEPNSRASSTPNAHALQPPASPVPKPEGTTSTRRPQHSEPSPQDSRKLADGALHPPRSSTPADRPLRLNLLGNLQVTHRHGDHHQDITSTLAPRQREVLAFLALHPNGARRETLTAALWPEAPTDRPYNALHATLSQLRRALRTATHEEALSEVIVRQDGPYTLDPERVSVDLWEAHESLDAARSGHSNKHRLAAVQRLDELYRGDLAEDVTAEWIEAPREALRRDVLDAFSALAHTIDDADPEQALILLERARILDRYNETLYEGIARLQARLGQQDAITRTLALLTKTLAEIGEHPSQETVALCAFLQRPRSTNRTRGQAS
ncbi:hypothetical protein [Streptomyces malaysiensis]|uniref:hypothetical protein n=1 Tax=Streptomyces malaysiensis TaxID=92644 RepID=UPI0033DDD495